MVLDGPGTRRYLLHPSDPEGIHTRVRERVTGRGSVRSYGVRVVGVGPWKTVLVEQGVLEERGRRPSKKGDRGLHPFRHPPIRPDPTRSVRGVGPTARVQTRRPVLDPHPLVDLRLLGRVPLCRVRDLGVQSRGGCIPPLIRLSPVYLKGDTLWTRISRG